jgi:hypothetical protein
MLPRSVSLDLPSNARVMVSEPFARHAFDTHDQLLRQRNANSVLLPQRGGFSSLASQPSASVFRGSIGNEIVSVR